MPAIRPGWRFCSASRGRISLQDTISASSAPGALTGRAAGPRRSARPSRTFPGPWRWPCAAASASASPATCWRPTWAATPVNGVTAGDIQRGAVGEIEACLLYADLSGFTDYAEATPPATVAERLNAYLDCMGAPVEARGGQILKFLGDGLLAVFMLDNGSEKAAVCGAALDAAEDALRRIAELNAKAGAVADRILTADIALHKGQVLYGNVGTALRLDFTVIGPAVNEAARLEGLCRDLGTNLLISSSFHAGAGPAQARMHSLGQHRLRGVRDTREVFTLR